MSRSTPYAAELARAEFADCRIERIFVRETLTEAIRFSDWRGGRFNPRALEIGEDELLVLIGDAVAAGVFSSDFEEELSGIVGSRSLMAEAVSWNRWIVVSVGDAGWAPHPNSPIFETEKEAEDHADNLTAIGEVGARSELLVKHVRMSEIDFYAHRT